MSLRPDDSNGGSGGQAAIILYGLISIGIAAPLVTLIGIFAGAVLLRDPAKGVLSLGAMAMAGLMVLGLTGSGIILAAIVILRRLRTLQRGTASIDQRINLLAEQSIVRNQEVSSETISIGDQGETVKLLQEIREILLLPEQARNRRFNRMVKREFKQRMEAIEGFVAAREFHQAREELRNLTDRFGDSEQIKQARDRLENATLAAQETEIVRASADIEDLMGLAQYGEAERLASSLTQKYPTATEAGELLEHVQEQRKTYEKKQRQSSHEEIQQYVNNRDWVKALEAVRQFLELFPTGPEADTLRQQLETLEGNAEIQTRQDLEKQFKNYLANQQYYEALSLARHIVHEYPLSPQADALHSQMPQLEELAKKQRAK